MCKVNALRNFIVDRFCFNAVRLQFYSSSWFCIYSFVGSHLFWQFKTARKANAICFGYVVFELITFWIRSVICICSITSVIVL